MELGGRRAHQFISVGLEEQRQYVWACVWGEWQSQRWQRPIEADREHWWCKWSKVKNSHLTKLFICMAVYVKQRELWHNERRSVSNTVKHTYGHKRKGWSKVHFALAALRTSLLNTRAPQSFLFHRHGGHLPYFSNHPTGERCIFKGLAILFLVVRQCNVTADNWQHCSSSELLKH